MTTSRKKIDWTSVRARLGQFQAQDYGAGRPDRDRLNEAFRQRALRLAQRGREESTQAKRDPLIAFRLGRERFAFELAHVKQMFSSVPTTPIPGACNLLSGIANLNGSLRSVVDLRVLVNLPTTASDAGHVVLLHAGGRLLGVWVEALEGVSHVDLDRLNTVSEVESETVGKLIRGMTDDRTLVLDATVLVERVAEQARQHANSQLQDRRAGMPDTAIQ